MALERGQDISTEEQVEEVKGASLLDKGEQEILKTFGEHIAMQNKQTTERIQKFKDWLDEFPDLKDMISVQKILSIIDSYDELIHSIWRERDYVKNLLEINLEKVDGLQKDNDKLNKELRATVEAVNKGYVKKGASKKEVEEASEKVSKMPILRTLSKDKRDKLIYYDYCQGKKVVDIATELGLDRTAIYKIIKKFKKIEAKKDEKVEKKEVEKEDFSEDDAIPPM